MENWMSIINHKIQQLEDEQKDLSPILEKVSALVANDIDKNFKAHGRWDGSGYDLFSGGDFRWKPLAASTKKQYGKIGYELEPTLLRTKYLRSSIEVFPLPPHSISISANATYAQTLQEGGINTRTASPASLKPSKNKIKDHASGTPMRPYLTLTPSDLQEIAETIAGY